MSPVAPDVERRAGRLELLEWDLRWHAGCRRLHQPTDKYLAGFTLIAQR